MIRRERLGRDRGLPGVICGHKERERGEALPSPLKACHEKIGLYRKEKDDHSCHTFSASYEWWCGCRFRFLEITDIQYITTQHHVNPALKVMKVWYSTVWCMPHEQSWHGTTGRRVGFGDWLWWWSLEVLMSHWQLFFHFLSATDSSPMYSHLFSYSPFSLLSSFHTTSSSPLCNFPLNVFPFHHLLISLYLYVDVCEYQ